MLNDEILVAWLKLATSPGLTASRATMMLRADRPLRQRRRTESPEDRAWREKLAHWREAGIVILPHDHPNYPAALQGDQLAPPLIFALGNLGLLGTAAVAVVGARSAFTETRAWVREQAAALAARGVTIISGGAEGVDTAAHEGALAGNGRTVVVLGSGLLRAFPPQNRPLFDEIVARGGLLISGVIPETMVSREQLLTRNRWITLLSARVVVAALGGRGGSWSTAHSALALGKRLGVVTRWCGDFGVQLVAKGAVPVTDLVKFWEQA